MKLVQLHMEILFIAEATVQNQNMNEGHFAMTLLPF